jgi:hypothetical protein
LSLAHSRLAARVEELLAADPPAWTELYAAVQALAAIEPRLGQGEMLTTETMAQRLGLSTKTLLKHKKAGAIRPAVQVGKLIRWRGNEALNGNENGNGRRK